MGTEFLGYVPEELYLFVQPGTSPTLVQVDDLATNTDADTDDTVTLTPASTALEYADAGVQIYRLTGFDQDTVRITSNATASVMAGKDSRAAGDWTVTPPSFAAGDDGAELGTLFYTVVHDSLTIFPTQDNTTITLTDLSDGDDTITVLLANGDTVGDYDIFTTETGPITPRTGVNIISGAGGALENDYVRVSADKPVLVYVGPASSDLQEYADVAFSVPTGPDSRIVYVFAQNGGAEALQIFGFDPATQVTITSLSHSIGSFHDFTIGGHIGPGGWKAGMAGGSVWWSSGVWRGEMLRIESTKPITVMAGDYDSPYFGTYIPFVDSSPELAPVAVIAPLPVTVCAGLPLAFDGSGSTDTDTAGGLPGIVSYAWHFGDGNTGTGPAPFHTYAAPSVYPVTLTVTDNDGETASDSAVVVVADCTEPPVAVLAADPGPWCVDEAVSLDGSGSFDADVIGPAPDIVSYAWDFGDGSTGTGASASHTYSVAGTYTVTLTVTDNDTQQATVTGLVEVVTCVIPATVDVKPGSEVNPLNLNGNGVLPIAVIGSADLDVSLIDVASVRAGADKDADGGIDDAPGGSPVHDGHLEDVNEDGVLDLVVHIREHELGIPVDTAGGMLVDIAVTGLLTDSTPWAGVDTVRINANAAASKGKGGKGPK